MNTRHNYPTHFPDLGRAVIVMPTLKMKQLDTRDYKTWSEACIVCLVIESYRSHVLQHLDQSSFYHTSLPLPHSDGCRCANKAMALSYQCCKSIIGRSIQALVLSHSEGKKNRKIIFFSASRSTFQGCIIIRKKQRFNYIIFEGFLLGNKYNSIYWWKRTKNPLCHN